MTTIKDLLNRIRWDKRENPADYIIFYYDRILKKLIHLNFNEIKKVEDNFILLIKDDKEINIPLHRIRKVMKKGGLIWER